MACCTQVPLVDSPTGIWLVTARTYCWIKWAPFGIIQQALLVDIESFLVLFAPTQCQAKIWLSILSQPGLVIKLAPQTCLHLDDMLRQTLA